MVLEHVRADIHHVRVLLESGYTAGNAAALRNVLDLCESKAELVGSVADDAVALVSVDEVLGAMKHGLDS